MLVSSAYGIKERTNDALQKSLIYRKINNRDSRWDPWGTHYVIVFKEEEQESILVYLFLRVKYLDSNEGDEVELDFEKKNNNHSVREKLSAWYRLGNFKCSFKPWRIFISLFVHIWQKIISKMFAQIIYPDFISLSKVAKKGEAENWLELDFGEYWFVCSIKSGRNV